MSNYKALSIAIGATFLSTLATGANAATFYVSTGDNQVGTIDDTTGIYTKILDSPTFADIALDTSNNLFGVDFGGLYSIDVNNSSTTLIGLLGSFLNALGFSDDNKLYGAGASGFYSVDVNTGKASLISTISGFSSSGDIVFDAANNVFWATSSGDSLWSITKDGVGTFVGNIGFHQVFGVSFGDDGTLYGYTGDHRQVAIDTATGSGQYIRTIAGLTGGIWGAASDPEAKSTPNNPEPPTKTVPEPTTMLGMVTFGAFLLRAKSRRRQA